MGMTNEIVAQELSSDDGEMGGQVEKYEKNSKIIIPKMVCLSKIIDRWVYSSNRELFVFSRPYLFYDHYCNLAPMKSSKFHPKTNNFFQSICSMSIEFGVFSASLSNFLISSIIHCTLLFRTIPKGSLKSPFRVILIYFQDNHNRGNDKKGLDHVQQL